MPGGGQTGGRGVYKPSSSAPTRQPCLALTGGWGWEGKGGAGVCGWGQEEEEEEEDWRVGGGGRAQGPAWDRSRAGSSEGAGGAGGAGALWMLQFNITNMDFLP